MGRLAVKVTFTFDPNADELDMLKVYLAGESAWRVAKKTGLNSGNLHKALNSGGKISYKDFKKLLENTIGGEYMVDFLKNAKVDEETLDVLKQLKLELCK